MGVRHILITGVTGFLGRSIVSAFHTRKDVLLYGHTRDVPAAKSVFREYNIHVVDRCDAVKLDELKIDTVIHLAGIAHDLSNRYTADDYYAVNDKGTRLLYDDFLKSQAGSFIFLSSIKAVVDTAPSPVKEDVSPAPVSAYGQSKLRAERYIQEHSVTAKSFYILRPCMVHGPGNKGNLNLLYKYVKTGLPFPLGSFKNQRSFLSVDNFIFVLSRLINVSIPSGIYHLADDGSLSTADLFRIIARTLGKSPRVFNIAPGILKAGFGVLKKGRMLNKLTEDMLVSNQKIKQHLGAPLPVTIEQGLVKTISSFDGSE